MNQKVAHGSAREYYMSRCEQMEDPCTFKAVLRELVIVQNLRNFFIVRQNYLLWLLRGEKEVSAEVSFSRSEIVDL